MTKTAQKGYQFNPCWDAAWNYGEFRKLMKVESGDPLSFHQWMQFADACFRAGAESTTNLRRLLAESKGWIASQSPSALDLIEEINGALRESAHLEDDNDN